MGKYKKPDTGIGPKVLLQVFLLRTGPQTSVQLRENSTPQPESIRGLLYVIHATVLSLKVAAERLFKKCLEGC